MYFWKVCVAFQQRSHENVYGPLELCYSMLCTQQCEWEDRRFWGQTPVNIMNFCRFVSVQKRKMLRLKWLAVLGVLLGTIRITHGSILEAQCRARCYSSASLHVSNNLILCSEYFVWLVH